MDSSDIEALVQKSLPKPFLSSLLEAVFLARRQSWDICGQQYAPQEAENLRPFVARANLEGLMRGSAERFGFESRVERESGQPWFHTELHVGSIVLTAATVPSPLAMVDPAEYRTTLAESNQLRFDIFEDLPSTVAKLYGILLHSRSVWTTRDERANFGHLPGSVHLAFPDSEFRSYVYWIDLVQTFPAALEKHIPNDWSEEARLQYIERTQRRIV